jgi:hypothetical protein
MSRATRLTDAIYLPSSVAISPAVEPLLIIFTSVWTSPLVHCLGLWFRTRQAPVRAEQ